RLQWFESTPAQFSYRFFLPPRFFPGFLAGFLDFFPPLFPRPVFFALDFLPRSAAFDFLPLFFPAPFVPPDLPRFFDLEATFFRRLDDAFAAGFAGPRT